MNLYSIDNVYDIYNAAVAVQENDMEYVCIIEKIVKGNYTAVVMKNNALVCKVSVGSTVIFDRELTLKVQKGVVKHLVYLERDALERLKNKYAPIQHSHFLQKKKTKALQRISSLKSTILLAVE